MTLNNYLMHSQAELGYVPAIVCKDGLHLSIQVGEISYCQPRDRFGPWTEVEVAARQLLPELEEFHSPSDSTERTEIYPWVPIEKAEALIAAHGGALALEEP